MMESSIPVEPPKISILVDLPEVAMGSTTPPIPHEPSYVVPNAIESFGKRFDDLVYLYHLVPCLPCYNVKVVYIML